jgi:hypothetical protein
LQAATLLISHSSTSSIGLDAMALRVALPAVPSSLALHLITWCDFDIDIILGGASTGIAELHNARRHVTFTGTLRAIHLEG